MAERDEAIRHSLNSNLRGILKTSLDHWKMYTTHKLRRKREMRKAVHSHNVRLVRKAMNSLMQNWIEANQNSDSLRESSTGSKGPSRRAREFQRRNILKRACHVWHTRTIDRRQRPTSNSEIFDPDNADVFREKKRNIELQKKAMKFHRRLLLRRFFTLWINRCDDEDVENTEWETAQVHCRRKLLRRSWFAWMEYRNAKYRRKNRMDDARKFYVERLLGRCLKGLSSNVHEEVANRRRFREAEDHCTKKLLARLFHTWLNYCRVERAVRNIISAQRENRDRSSKQEALKQWRLCVRNKKCSRRKNNVARSHYERNLLARSIVSLRRYQLYRKEKATRLDYLRLGTALITLEILRVHVEGWRVSVVRVAQERQKNLRAEDHWSSRQIERHFFRWKQFCERRKSKAGWKCALNKIGETVLLNKYVNLWFGRYKALEPIRMKEIQAASRYATKLQLCVFRSWKRYANEKVVRRNEIAEAHNFHKKLLLREGLKESLKFCLYKTESRYEKRSRCARRNSAEDFDTMKKFFVKWLEHVYTKGGEKDSNRLICDDDNQRILGFSCAPTPTRLVLPEYMLRQINIDSCNNKLFVEAFEDNCENNGKKRAYYSPHMSGYSTTENSLDE